MTAFLKILLRVLAVLLAAVILIVGGYVVYVLASYYRIEDNLTLTVNNSREEQVRLGQEYTVSTSNLGFGAYSQEYSFFMDGGTESRAYSKEAVYENIGGMLGQLEKNRADFMLFQEVDVDATRSYHVDESKLIGSTFPEYGDVFACNYDSPYLFYPILRPHGKSKSGLMTLSRFAMTQSVRRSLPIETGFYKFFDLDRCYTVTRLPIENSEREFVLINLHLSAYTSDGTVATRQLEQLLGEMQEEYAKGNYVLAAGDFNKDLLGDSSEIFGVKGQGATWAQPFPEELLPDEIALVTGKNAPSCRNCDMGYVKGETFVLTVDGFLVTDNIAVTEVSVQDLAFQNSDHNPVLLQFSLEEL